MERMKQENTQLISSQTERESSTAELQGLRSHLTGDGETSGRLKSPHYFLKCCLRSVPLLHVCTDLERELEGAVARTESLKTERQMAAQRPLTDGTCLR